MQAEQIMHKYQVEVLTEQVRPGQRLLCFVVTYTALFHNITHVKSPDQLSSRSSQCFQSKKNGDKLQRLNPVILLYLSNATNQGVWKYAPLVPTLVPQG